MASGAKDKIVEIITGSLMLPPVLPEQESFLRPLMVSIAVNFETDM